jgi:hypothetical protein
MIWREYLLPQRRLKILFSHKPVWEKDIKRGFSHTRHEISFGEFARSTIEESDLVVPLTIEDLRYLTEARSLVADNPLPIPSAESIELCDDKCRFNQTLVDHSFGEFVPPMGGRPTYPYILKKRVDAWGTNSHVVKDAEDEKAFSHLRGDPDYFVQQFVPGRNEYATHIVFRRGRIVCWLNIEYGFSTATPIKGQDKITLCRPCLCPHLKLFASILNVIGFEGLCCFNYKELEGRRPMIIENNPRFGGSLAPYFFGMVRHIAR